MPTLTLLETYLVAVHDLLGQFLTDDARFTVDTVLQTLVAEAAHLHLPKAPPLRITHTPTYFRTNLRQEVVEVTGALLTLLQLTDPTLLLGYQWQQFLAPSEEKRRLERWMVAAQDHKAFLHTFLFMTPAGRHLTIREWVLPVHDPRDGVTLVGWFGFVQSLRKVIPITEPRRVPLLLPGESEQRA
jgi:hypothetical protein